MKTKTIALCTIILMAIVFVGCNGAPPANTMFIPQYPSNNDEDP